MGGFFVQKIARARGIAITKFNVALSVPRVGVWQRRFY
jgi:hypothetical protein